MEAPIDTISVEALYGSFGCSHLLSLNGLRKSALYKFLEEHPDVEHVFLGLDSDEPGQEMSKEIEAELNREGKVTIVVSPWPHKDWNDLLISLRT